MIKLIRFLGALALLGLAQGAARAEEDACKLAEWGYSYARVEQRGDMWTYLLTVGPNWRTHPFGYHAPGWLSCENCLSASVWAGGLIHFVSEATLNAHPSARAPATAAARAERRRESVGYSPDSTGKDRLEHRGSRESIVVGPLIGYAVLYRVMVPEQATKSSADPRTAREPSLLVIHLTDGCVTFEASLLINFKDGGDPWTVVDSLLAELTIGKLRGAPPGPVPPQGQGFIVKPKQ
jgi:hypothetical protein